MFIYWIIGLLLIAFTGSRTVAKDETALTNPYFWLANVLCVIFWPVLIGWVIYDLFHIVHD